MMQTKWGSLRESGINQIVAVSYALAFYWYLFGFTLAQGLSTTLFFSVAGLIRVYVIRRITEWFDRRRDKDGR